MYVVPTSRVDDPARKNPHAINLAPLRGSAQKSETRERPREQRTQAHVIRAPPTQRQAGREIPRIARVYVQPAYTDVYMRTRAIGCNIVQGTNYGREEKRRGVAIPTLNSARQRIPRRYRSDILNARAVKSKKKKRGGWGKESGSRVCYPGIQRLRALAIVHTHTRRWR